MGLLSSIAKVALPAVGSLLGLSGKTKEVVGMVGQGVADSISSNASAKSTAADFKQQKQLQDEFNIFSASQAQKQMDFQRESADTAMQFSDSQAQRLMDFQERMSNTAHQREMADMKAAGINPMLMAKYGGASSPSGGAASGITSSGAQPGSLQSPAQTKASATAARHALLAEKSIEADIDLKRSQAQATRAEAGLKGSQTTELDYRQKERIDQGLAKVMQDIEYISAQAAGQRFENMIKTEITLPSGQIDIQKAELVLEELRMKLDILRSPKGKTYIERELGNRGGHVSGSTTTINTIIQNGIDKILEMIPYPYGTK